MDALGLVHQIVHRSQRCRNGYLSGSEIVPTGRSACSLNPGSLYSDQQVPSRPWKQLARLTERTRGTAVPQLWE